MPDSTAVANSSLSKDEYMKLLNEVLQLGIKAGASRYDFLAICGSWFARTGISMGVRKDALLAVISEFYRLIAADELPNVPSPTELQ